MGIHLDEGFFIAQKLPDGTPGRPIGTDEAISVFEDLTTAIKIRDEMALEHSDLEIFKINIVFVGRVLG